LMIAIITRVKWYITMVLISISIMISEMEHFYTLVGFFCVFFGDMII
jgi:hypothetical protein